jgi:hypothetical protein
MNWDTPFGTKLQISLIGTTAFPSLRLNMVDVLPKQSPEDDSIVELAWSHLLGSCSVMILASTWTMTLSLPPSSRRPKSAFVCLLRMLSKLCRYLMNWQFLGRHTVLF